MAGFRDRVRRGMAQLGDRRRAAVVAVLIGWAIVVGVAAADRPDGRTWLGVPSLADILLVLIVIASLFGLVLFVAMLLSIRKGEADLPARRSLWPSLVVMALLLAVAVRLRSDRDPETAVPQPVETADGPTNVELRTPVLGQEELIALIVIAGLAVAMIIWTRRRIALADDQEDDPIGDDHLRPIIGRAVTTLDLGTDPRSAVLGAYAALEDALGGLGRARAPAETPAEYVERVLYRFPTAAPSVVELAELYALARFSDRTITPADQRRAADALRRARDELPDGRIDDRVDEPVGLPGGGAADDSAPSPGSSR